MKQLASATPSSKPSLRECKSRPGQGILEDREVAFVHDLDHLHEDETVAAVQTRGPLPLPLEGWDQASTWGWDEATGSLYVRLRRNTDGQGPAIEVGPDDYTPAITCDTTLAQHIAMAADCDLGAVLMALDDASGLNDQDDAPADHEGGTVVTMTEGYGLPK